MSRRWGLVVGGVALVALALEVESGLGAPSRVAPSNADRIDLAVQPPVARPGPPRVTSVLPAPRALVVSWVPPVDPGGAPVDRYRAVAAPGGDSCEVAAPATTCTIGNLNNGQFFTVTVQAANVAGFGPPSPPSAPVRPRPG